MTDSNETTNTKRASNTIFLFQGNLADGSEQHVRTFRATSESKSPKRALTRFLNLVIGDPENELHAAAMSDKLWYMSGHTQQVQLRTRPQVVLG